MPRNADDSEDDPPRRPRRRDEEGAPRSRRRDRDDEDKSASPKGKSKLLLLLGLVAAVLLPLVGLGIYFAVNQSRKAAEAAGRKAVADNLTTIGNQIDNYELLTGGFPTNSYDAAGKPLLSWRVHLLSYLRGEQGLYDQFRLDEPWDSPHNQTLLSKMPKTYGTAAEASGAVPVGTKTFFRGFAAPGAVMEKGVPRPGKPRGPSTGDVKDGLKMTLFCVEAGEAVEWTKPDDLAWTPGQPLPALGGSRVKSDVFFALFLDRTVRPLKKSMTPENLKAAVTYAGNDVFKLD